MSPVVSGTNGGTNGPGTALLGVIALGPKKDAQVYNRQEEMMCVKTAHILSESLKHIEDMANFSQIIEEQMKREDALLKQEEQTQKILARTLALDSIEIAVRQVEQALKLLSKTSPIIAAHWARWIW